ncbi:putative nuclease HARBI1 [Rhinichthys klamathensis goyatoka]|uniref:putative nuclease HARBI1 n=1 Tax=Rhinichthys klamathensis goyatoka TaxID=3034132 RepID=UPI0024B54DB8|nr:putative nuclease HARBI1 [Rhinichthys klamathensis goyatoka]
MELLDLLRPALARLTQRNFALSPEVQLLAALRFFATGSFIEVVGEGYGLSKTSVWRCVHTVTNALLRHAGDCVRQPATRQEVQEVHQGCHAIAGIPRVLGLVDGTLIPIANPSVIDQAYISRKGYAAINVQVIVDHRGVISDLVARWPGSTHDSFVWANSAVGEQAEREGFGQSLFLGDSGYPLRTYLFTPLTNPQTRAERAYNVAHIRTRNVFECAIGIWKLRFRCLHKSSGGLRMKPHSSCAVTVATAILHNMAVRGGAPIPEGEEEEIDTA